MTVFTKRFHRYNINSAAEHNTKLAGIIPAGVYSGFFMQVNGSDPQQIDLILGSDTESVAVTNLGVRLSLSEMFPGVATALPSESLTRVDTIVIEYPHVSEFSTVEPTVRIIRYGTAVPAAAVVLGYVRVNAFASRLLQEDLLPVARVGRAFECVVSPAGSTGVYIFGGKYMNATGSGIVNFKGAYYDFKTTTITGSYLWVLLGLNDSGIITVMQTGASYDSLNIGGYTEYPVAAVKVAASKTVMQIETCVLPARSSYIKIATDDYVDTLGASVFSYISVDILDDNTKSRIAPSSGIIELPAGSGYFLTENMLTGHVISNVKHICLLVDASCPMTFAISRDDSLNETSDTPYRPNTILRVTEFNEAFLKIEVDPSYAGEDQRVYGYALLYVLDEGTVNRDTLSLTAWANLNSNIGSIAPDFEHFPYSWRQGWGASPLSVLTGTDMLTFPPGVAADSRIFCRIPAAPYAGKAISFAVTHVSGVSFRIALSNSTSATRKTTVVGAGCSAAVTITVDDDAEYVEAAIEAINTVSATSPITVGNPRVCMGIYSTIAEQGVHAQTDKVYQFIRVYQSVYGSVGMELPISFPVNVPGGVAVIISDDSVGFSGNVSANVSGGALIINGTMSTDGVAIYDLNIGVRIK